MALKKKNEIKLKIVAATSVVIFTLFACFSGAYAWFTSIRNVGSTSDDFKVSEIGTSVRSITVHSFLGESSADECFNFDPVGVTAYDPSKKNTTNYDSEGFYTGTAIALNEYSLESPNHPVLMMFEMYGAYEKITFKTDYTFLGYKMPEEVAEQYASYSALTADQSNLTSGKYYLVNDTGHLYLYGGGSSYTDVSYSSYNSLPESGVNNRFYMVLEDEVNGIPAAIYKYTQSGTSGAYKMKWTDIGIYEGDENNAKKIYNPLSSVVNFYWYEYTGVMDNENLSTANNIIVGKNGIKSDTTNETLANNTHCISIAKSTMNDSSRYSSFSNFTSEEEFEYENEKVVYEGDVLQKTYVGIMINYAPLALEYIFSNNLGHEALNFGLHFKCDWVTEF